MAREGTLFILVGPSGAGKNTLMENVQDRLGNDLPQLPTYTTREPRGTEQEGVEHHFVTHAEFLRLKAVETFVEAQKVHGDNYYGTPRAAIEEAIHAPHDLVADIDFLGADEVRKAYPAHTVIIFVTPPSLDVLETRIRNRGPIEPDDLARRLKRARYELTYAPQCDYLVVNDDLGNASEDLYQIVIRERAARSGEPGSRPVTPHVVDGQVIALIDHNGHMLARADGLPPSFALESRIRHPYETLKARLSSTFVAPVKTETPDDTRFKFVAPRYVALEATPPQFRLYYCYRCFWPKEEAIPSGWTWTPADRLILPESIRAQGSGERYLAD